MQVDDNRVELRQWLAQRPSWFPNALLIVAPLVFSAAWLFDSWEPIVFLVVLALIMVGTGLWISHLRENLEEERSTSRKQLLEELEKQELENRLYLMEELITAVANTATPVPNNGTQRERDRNLSAARGALLTQAKTLIGKNKGGVRANLFEIVDVDEIRLEADTFGSTHQTRSTRKFTQESESIQFALAGGSRLVEDTADLKESCTYGTFATVPVLIEDHLYGLLTVDSPSPGDLSQWDVRLLEFFGFMFAILYAQERSPKYIKRSEYLDLTSTPARSPVR